jgi:hypothetical protein
MKRTALVLTALLAVTSTASAASLQNKDSKSYDIKVKGSSSTMSTNIQAGTTKGSICSSCTITVSGVGEITVSGSDRAVIKNGKLSK